jgi:TRAP-type C4-dicarboxylate transport system permease small subunit
VRPIDKTIQIIELVEDWLLVFLLFAMISVAASQVILRNVFDMGLLWGDGSVRVLLLWVAMFGAMVASRKDEHIRIDLIGRIIPEVYRSGFARICCFFTAGVLGVFAVSSLQFVHYEYLDQTKAFGAVPAWFCETIMPVGALIMCLRYLAHGFKRS